MDVVAEMKKRRCDPGPVHSPNDECPCDMEQPCSCAVDGAAIDEIKRLRAALQSIADAHVTFYSEIAREALAAQNA